MSLRYVQTPAISLYSGMSVSDTSCKVTPYPVDLDGVKLTMTDFGTTAYFTVDPKITGYEEICSFTGITDNGDGTATLTGLTRNLLGKAPYTASSTGGKLHGSSAVVVFTDNPQLFANLLAQINFGAANASTMIQGVLQVGTAAQINAGTANGSTGAPLAVTPDALLASIFYLNLPTSDQKNAMAGTSGTPSASNKFVTNADTSGTGAVVRNSLIPTNFLTTVTSGATTRLLNAANGTQTIAHGLGATPKQVTLQFQVIITNAFCIGTILYTGTTQTGSIMGMVTTSGGAAYQNGNRLNVTGTSASDFQEITVTTDGTNINLAWVKGGSPAGATVNIIWTAIA